MEIHKWIDNLLGCTSSMEKSLQTFCMCLCPIIHHPQTFVTPNLRQSLPVQYNTRSYEHWVGHCVLQCLLDSEQNCGFPRVELLEIVVVTDGIGELCHILLFNGSYHLVEQFHLGTVLEVYIVVCVRFQGLFKVVNVLKMLLFAQVAQSCLEKVFLCRPCQQLVINTHVSSTLECLNGFIVVLPCGLNVSQSHVALDGRGF
mmetsp:Transcript_2102/g.7611  ORF Transcript_2102/g.7611 Transcript_2102/m.7611 type:complete len:201 (-) Transcript_2102:673-1275(-)